MNEATASTPPARKIKWHAVIPIVFWVVVVAVSAPLIYRSCSHAESQARLNFCLNQLMQIDAAKEQARMRFNWPVGTPVADGDTNVNMYIRGLAGTTNTPTCPSGGTYTYNAVGTGPTCSFPGHALAAP